MTYADGEKRYILAADGCEGRRHAVIAGDRVDILPGNALPLKNIPLGTQLHNVEMKPGKGGQIARQRRVQLGAVDRQGGSTTPPVRMPSGEVRRILEGVRGDGWAGRQCRSRERVAGQGGPQAMARAADPMCAASP